MFALLSVFAAAALPRCEDLDYWLFNCSLSLAVKGSETDESYEIVDCPKSGEYEVPCVPLVECEGTRTQAVTCYPTEGKSASVALILSVFVGWLGVDRFYLEYWTIGLFKLFTGGFFGLAWYLDIFLIALQIVKPARGGVYRLGRPAQFIVRLPGKNYF